MRFSKAAACPARSSSAPVEWRHPDACIPALPHAIGLHTAHAAGDAAQLGPSEPCRRTWLGGGFISYELKAYTGTIFGSAGIRTSNHPASKLINLRFGTTMKHVAYHGAVPALTDLSAGRIHMR